MGKDIRTLISSHYEHLHSMLDKEQREKMIAQARTNEDLLQDVILTAITKYDGQDLEGREEEVKEYLEKSLLMACKFQYKKIDRHTVYLEEL